MEPFLPSEIARLVYGNKVMDILLSDIRREGYLDEAKCDEAARSFLEHCPHLSECLAANKEGKGFNTRPGGYSLTDILEEYCEIRSMVAECLQKLPKNSADKLWQCDSLIEQLRYLIDSSQAGQMLLVSIRVPPKESPAKGTSSSVTPSPPTHNHLRIIGSSNRMKRTAVRSAHGSKQQCSKDADDMLSSISNRMLSVEATPLENLPGTSGNVDNQNVQSGGESENIQNVSQSGHTAECEHVDPAGSVISHKASLLKSSIYPSNQCQKCCDKSRTSKYQQHSSCVRTSPAVDSPNSSAVEDAPSCFSSPKRKLSLSSKRKSANPTPMKGSHTPLKTQTPCKVRRSHTDSNESSENIDFSMLTRALLDNTELHKKIAENINRVIHKPGAGESLENSENHPFPSTDGDPGSAETYPMATGCNSVASSCDGMLQELNQTIKTIVERTEQDPVFERFLDEIIAPLEEEMTPSSVDLQSEDDNGFPDLAVTTKPTRNVDIDTHDATSTPNKKSSSLSSAEVAGCSKYQQVFQERRIEDSSNVLCNDVPLKQRLRSATQHKSDTSSGSNSVNSMASSGKEKKREGTSLEDQNAAAIQCIVDAKISTQSTYEVSHSNQLQSNVCLSMPSSTMDTQTFSTTTSGGNCHEKQGYYPGQLLKAGSVVASSLQKEVSQISDGMVGSVDVGSSNNTKVVNESVQNTEVILLDANLTFLNNNASFSLNTGTNSSFVTNPSPFKMQLSAPLVATSQPSVSAAATNQVMTVMLPGTTGTIQQAATLSGIPLYPTCEQTAPHSLATNSPSQVVAVTIPGPQNVNSAVKDHVSTVIMCGNDGIIPQFVTVPYPDLRGSYLLSGSSGPCRMPIVPRGAVIPKARTVHKDAKPGPSKHARLSKSQRKKKISSTDEKILIRNTFAVSTNSAVSKPSAVVGVILSADNSRDNVILKSPDTGQQSSAGCGLSLPSIMLESPETKMLSTSAQQSRVTPSQGYGQEKLLGALNLKEASDSSVNQKPVGIDQDKGIRSENKLNADDNESVKSKSALILQNAGKFPPSPQLMTLVNLSRNPAISGCSPSILVPGTVGETTVDKVSEVKLTQKPRETPQPTTSQGKTSVDSKRLSLTTPRRHRHVRALDFTTPPKARTVPKDLQPKESSPNTMEKVAKTSQRSIRNGVNKARSTLFKSPNESETTVCDTPLSTVKSSVSSACSDNYVSIIATRSPLPRLCGGWDNAAGVGQIICDESGSDFSAAETQHEVNVMDKQSEVTKGSTKLVKNRETGCKMTQKLTEESLVSVKSQPSSRKAWDFELRACLNDSHEGVQLSSNDSSSTTNKTKKRRKTKTKSRRKKSHVTEKEIRSLEEHLNKDEHTDNGSLIKNQGSQNGASENTSSNLVIPLNTSTKSSEKNYDGGTKNQNRELNTVVAPLIKEKVDHLRKNVEPTSESNDAHLVEKLSVKFSSKYKSRVPGPKLSRKKDGDQPTDLSDNRGSSDKGEVARESDGKEQVKGVKRKGILALGTSNSKKADLSKSSSSSTVGVQRKEVLALETSDGKKADLSKSSDSSAMETVSSSISVGSVVTMASCFQVGQSPIEQKAGERRMMDHSMHIHQSPNTVAIETIVSRTNDLGTSTSLVAAASGIDCVSVGGSASVADSQPVPVSQSVELVSSSSGFYPSESQNKDFQASCHHKEQSLANTPDDPLLKISGTQKPVCDTVNVSDPQTKVVISPILDTPRKINDPSSNCWGIAYMSIPLTPRLRSPHPDDTPITKQVNGNSCVPFSVIETPSFPPTPNIAVTPLSYHATQSTPSSARSTEYCAGSAYYKPSDRLDCSISPKPLEQVLIEECRKLENTITAQTSYTHNESHEKDTDHGQQLPLSVTDKTLGEANSGTDFQVKVHVGKDVVLHEVDEGQGSVVGGTRSSKKQKRAKVTTKKSGVRNRRNCDKTEDKKITRKKAAGSLSKKASGIEDKSSEMCTLPRRKARPLSGTANANGSCDVEQRSLRGQTSASVCTNKDSVYISSTANESSDFDDKPSETHTSASLSGQKKARTVNKNHKGQVDFLVDALLSEKQQWTKEKKNKSDVRDHGNSTISKGAKIARKKKTGSPPSKASSLEDKPLEMYVSSRRKARPVSGPAYESGDFASASSKKKVSVAGKRKARPNTRSTKKSSNLEDEPPGTQKNQFKGVEGKNEDEKIQRFLGAAKLKLVVYSSPSDDSDFESSNDFGQSEVGTKTVQSNDGNDEQYTELKTAKESGTEQETGHSSKLYSTYLGDGNTDVQQMVEPQRQDEVKRGSGLSLTREKSPHLPSSCSEEQMKETHSDKTVNSESLLCHSEVPGFEVFKECDLSINDSRKSPSCFTNDSVDTNSHTSSSSGKNITLNDKLIEKKHCGVAKLKDKDVSSSMPNSVVKECEERDGGAIFSSKSVPSSLEHSGSIENNSMCSYQDMDARKQLRDKEGSLTKTALSVPTKVIRGTGAETTPSKKTSHLSVEAIADRLTREKIAVQAPSVTQPPVGQPLTDDSSAEDFPVLHLSADYDSLSESLNLSQVESRLAKLHGVEGATSDILAVGSTPRSASDVYRDLEQTPNRFQGVQSNVKLSSTVDMLEHERQELACKERSSTSKKKHGREIANKKLSRTERLENTNKKIRTLLGDDVSPLKIVTEASEVSKDMEHGILNEVLPATEKHNLSIKGNQDVKLENKLIERSGMSSAEKEMVQEKEVFSKQNKVGESGKMKTTNTSKFYQTSAVEVTDALDTVDSRREGLPSQDTSMMYEHHQVSSNEVYIEVVYGDEGPEEHNLVFEDISNFSLTFELGEHLAEGVETHKCTISEFQELFCASPKDCTSRSESCDSDQCDVKRRNITVNCTNNKSLGHVTSSKDRDRESFHEGRSAGLYIEEHETRSCSPYHKKSADFSRDRMRSSHSHKGSPPPVHRRRTLSANPGRNSQCWDRRAPSSSSSSPVLVKSKFSTFSPLNELYNEYLNDEKDVRFVSHCNERGQYFNFRSHEQLPFGHRGRGRTRYYDRHIHSQRGLVHSSSRESRCTSSSSSSSSHGRHDRRSVQDVRVTEMDSTKVSGGTALLTGAPTAVEDMEQQPLTVDTQIKGVEHGRQKVLAGDESPEEGELLDDDSLPEYDEDRCDDKHVVWLQKYPSAVGNVQAEKLSEDTPSILKGNKSASNMASDQSLEQNRSAAGKPSQEPEKTQKKSIQKEGSFAGPSAGRALPPKKRKASSEELSVPEEKRIRTDGPQALLKKVDLDHLLDFVHGEKLG